MRKVDYPQRFKVGDTVRVARSAYSYSDGTGNDGEGAANYFNLKKGQVVTVGVVYGRARWDDIYTHHYMVRNSSGDNRDALDHMLEPLNVGHGNTSYQTFIDGTCVTWNVDRPATSADMAAALQHVAKEFGLEAPVLDPSSTPARIRGGNITMLDRSDAT